jgi:type IV secretory pathway VirB6-like protein
MRLCQLFLASRISRHIFLATTTKTNTSGNILFYTDFMSNKQFLNKLVGGTTTRPVTYKPYYSREANVSFRNSSHNAKNIYARADNNNPPGVAHNRQQQKQIPREISCFIPILCLINNFLGFFLQLIYLIMIIHVFWEYIYLYLSLTLVVSKNYGQK